MTEDAALVRAAWAGDAASLGVLLERHRAALHATAAGILGPGPAAEDAVHDTFVIALRRIGELREPAAARGWLLAILVNVCRGELRRRPPVPPPEPRDDTSPVEAAIERSALRDWVWTALARLPDAQRLVVVLRYFTGASSYEAIAELSGVPVGTVRSRLHAARARLADELLATAAEAYDERDGYLALAAATDAAMWSFAATGDVAALRDVFASDLRYRLADGVEREGLDGYAAALCRDMEDGVVAHPVNVVVGPGLAVAELRLENPPDQPLHCPPAVTQVHLHDGHETRRMIAHYAAQRT